MKKLVLAAVAASIALPMAANATSILDNRTSQIMNCIESGKTGNALENCVEDVIQWTINNGAHEATKEIAAFVEAETGVNTINGGHEVDAVKQQIRIALNQESFEAQQTVNEASNADEVLAGIQAVVSDHKKRAGENFAKDPVGYMAFAFNYLEDRQADLRRAEDRIRQLEDKLDYYRSGGAWNPGNW